MKIGLIDADGHNFPNLPLMKISAYHKAHGDHVEWWNGLDWYDKVYKSRVFSDKYTEDISVNPSTNFCINADEIVLGGTGYAISEQDGVETYIKALDTELPQEIENQTPDYSIYGFKEAYGFLTRGCPRNCGFCIVSKKEGRKSCQVADLKDFHRQQKEIMLLDPNILACKDHEKLLQQLAGSGAWVDFTQGLDIRLTTKDNIKLLNKVKIKMVHFAWDDPKQDLTEHFNRFNDHSKIQDRRKKCVYVLTNYKSTHEEDLHRVYTIRDMGFNPYIMIYDKPNAPQETRWLARWVNNKRIFLTINKFEEYDPEQG
jgi:hypothetical protein